MGKRKFSPAAHAWLLEYAGSFDSTALLMAFEAGELAEAKRWTAAAPAAAPPPEPQSEKPYLLAACPFCGNSNPGTLFVETVGELCSGHCDECCASGPEFETADEAIAAWNRAAPPADPLVQAVLDAADKWADAEPGFRANGTGATQAIGELRVAVAARRASREQEEGRSDG
jgi:hypothetical protein